MTSNRRSTPVAAKNWSFPLWSARMTTVPTSPVKVTVVPETVAGPETIEKSTGKVELAVALIVKAGSFVNLSRIPKKLMFCSCFPL